MYALLSLSRIASAPAHPHAPHSSVTSDLLRTALTDTYCPHGPPQIAELQTAKYAAALRKYEGFEMLGVEVPAHSMPSHTIDRGEGARGLKGLYDCEPKALDQSSSSTPLDRSKSSSMFGPSSKPSVAHSPYTPIYPTLSGALLRRTPHPL